MIEVFVKSLIEQANTIQGLNSSKPDAVQLSGVFITPTKSIKAIAIDGMAEFSDFINNRSEDITVSARLQPNVYINDILTYKDDLLFQLIISSGSEYIVREYVAVPLLDKDPRIESNMQVVSDLEGIGFNSMTNYHFQLMDKSFSQLKDIEVSSIAIMSDMDTFIPYIMDKYGNNPEFIKEEKYEGVVMDLPTDNSIRYSSILIPEGTKLINLPVYLQESEDYGVYNTGMCCFFKQRRWWITSLFNPNRYDNHPKPLNIIRVPKDKIPSVQFSYFVNEVGINIIATGLSEHTNGNDIQKQNKGVGNRLIMSDAISGESGVYYNNGRAITTRGDKMAEFQTSERNSGRDYLPLNKTPTSNVQKYATINASNEGEIVTVEWHNSDTGILEPGHPVRYQYIGDDETMVTRKGILLGFRTDYFVQDSLSLMMKRGTVLYLFIKKQDNL